jgi:hypothetical protein
MLEPQHHEMSSRWKLEQDDPLQACFVQMFTQCFCCSCTGEDESRVFGWGEDEDEHLKKDPKQHDLGLMNTQKSI